MKLEKTATREACYSKKIKKCLQFAGALFIMINLGVDKVTGFGSSLS